jgi:hypothetical protein
MTAARWYEGHRDIERRTTVTVHEPGAAPVPLTHYPRHSPAGFEWGYGGSGPADLARALLIDALGKAALCPDCEGSRKVVFLHPETDPEPVPYCPEIADGLDLELVAPCICTDGIRTLPYHDFKFAVVAGWSGDDWRITRAEIIEFLTTLHPPDEELPAWLADVVAGAAAAP